MDNLTHSLVGWAMGETGLASRTRKGLAACILAANMPDIDVFFGWVPWPPLAMHRGFTHGLVGGVLLMPPLLAGLLWVLDRWQVGRGANFTSGLPMRAGWLVVLSYLGALTHPLLDLQNTYAVQLMSPVSGRWFHTDGLFIVDPWVLAMLGAALWLCRRRRRASAQRADQPARVALAAVAGYILLNMGISQAAYAKAQRFVAPVMNGAPAVVDRVFAAPLPLLFWRRDVLVRWKAGERGIYRKFPFDPLGLWHAPPGNLIDDNMSHPAVKAAVATSPAVRRFLAWSQMPYATVRHTGCGSMVTFGDARFIGLPNSGSFRVEAGVPGRCSGR